MSPQTACRTLILTTAALCACSEAPERVPAGGPGASTQRPQPGAGQTPASAPVELVFPAQEGWIEEPPSNSMRKAQFRLPAAEGDTDDATLVVFFFPNGGSWEANVQRWCGQLSQPDGSSTFDKAVMSSRTVAGLPAREVEVGGTFVAETTPGSGERVNKPDWTLLAAAIEGPRGSWFPKLVGPEKTVAHWRASYRQFLGAIHAAE